MADEKSSIHIYCDPRLRELACKEADKAGLTLSEFSAKKLAAALGKPGLGNIPRKRMGAPRKEVS